MKRVPFTLGILGVFAVSVAIVSTQQPQAPAQGQPTAVQGQPAAQGQPAPQGEQPPAQGQTPPGRGPGGGGRGGPPPMPTNLQVLDKNMTTPEVQAFMQQNVAPALGVQCTYCHANAPTPPPPADGAPPPPAAGRGRGGAAQLDFALDDKPEKKTARAMLKMVNEINGTLATAVGKPKSEVVQVQCVTCHRGVNQPKQLSSILMQTMLSKGEGAAIAKYRELRNVYYGMQAYDFTEPTLVRLAQESLDNKKSDDAMAWLKLNLEFYPKSAPSYVTMSQVHVRKNDRSSAIRDLEQALTIEPDNMPAKRQLEQLKAQTPGQAQAR